MGFGDGGHWHPNRRWNNLFSQMNGRKKEKCGEGENEKENTLSSQSSRTPSADVGECIRHALLGNKQLVFQHGFKFKQQIFGQQQSEIISGFV